MKFMIEQVKMKYKIGLRICGGICFVASFLISFSINKQNYLEIIWKSHAEKESFEENYMGL